MSASIFDLVEEGKYEQVNAVLTKSYNDVRMCLIYLIRDDKTEAVLKCLPHLNIEKSSQAYEDLITDLTLVAAENGKRIDAMDRLLELSSSPARCATAALTQIFNYVVEYGPDDMFGPKSGHKLVEKGANVNEATSAKQQELDREKAYIDKRLERSRTYREGISKP